MKNEDFLNKRNGIKETRLQVGLSQSKASKALGIPLKTFQNWEQEIRECPKWLEDIIIEKLWDWYETDWEINGEKYLENFLNNNYQIRYIEYGIEKNMEADATGGTKELKKMLDYWQGAYQFEYCTAPTIIEILSPKGKKLMIEYIKKFNKKSKEITYMALEDMDHQNMNWAKPKSTKDMIARLRSTFSEKDNG